jgi:hypothetical protein
VWVTAHRHLIGDGTEQLERLGKNSNPFCRPRQVLIVPRQSDVSSSRKAASRNPSPRADRKSSIQQG